MRLFKWFWDSLVFSSYTVSEHEHVPTKQMCVLVFSLHKRAKEKRVLEEIGWLNYPGSFYLWTYANHIRYKRNLGRAMPSFSTGHCWSFYPLPITGWKWDLYLTKTLCCQEFPTEGMSVPLELGLLQNARMNTQLLESNRSKWNHNTGLGLSRCIILKGSLINYIEASGISVCMSCRWWKTRYFSVLDLEVNGRGKIEREAVSSNHTRGKNYIITKSHYI